MEHKGFRKLYLFSYESKTTMGLYFTSFVLVYLIFGRITIGPESNIDLWTAVQMVIACGLIGFGHRLIITKGTLSIKRCFSWVVWSSVITVGFTVGFGWYNYFPLWCGVVFCSAMIIGFMMLWLALYWEAGKETRKLNEKLQDFQSKEWRG